MVLIRVPARTTGGAGGLTFAIRTKPVDEIVNNTIVVQDDDELFIPLNANTNYGFLVTYLTNNVNPAADFRATFIGPAGAVGQFGPTQGSAQASLALGVEDTTQADGDGSWLHVGFIKVGGTAGNLQLQWAQAAATVADTILRAGSTLVVWEQT